MQKMDRPALDGHWLDAILMTEKGRAPRPLKGGKFMRYPTLFNDVAFDPFRLFDQLEKGYYPATRPADAQREMRMIPACDVSDRETHYLVSVDLPGVAKNDIKIDYKEGSLTISAERHWERREGDHSERKWGRYERVITLPENVTEDDIQARYGDGVLYVAVPKKEKVQPKSIQVGDALEQEEKQGFWKKLLDRSDDKKKAS